MPNENAKLDLENIENQVVNEIDNNVDNEPVVVEEPQVQVASLKDEDIVEVQVNGEVVRMPWKEARGGIQRQADYTRKTQDISKKAKELETLFTGLTAKQKELMEKEAAIDAVLGRTPRATDSKVDSFGEDDVLTYGQLSKVLDDFASKLTTNVSSKVDEATLKDQEARTFQRWEEKTEEIVEAIQKEHPILEDIAHLSVILKREALKAEPKTEKEMLQAIRAEGKKMAEKINKRFTEQRKAELVKKQQLATKGPEPSGGAPTFNIANKTYGQNRVVNWSEIESDVIAALEGAD